MAEQKSRFIIAPKQTSCAHRLWGKGKSKVQRGRRYIYTFVMWWKINGKRNENGKKKREEHGGGRRTKEEEEKGIFTWATRIPGLLVVSAFAYGIRDRFTGDSEVYAGSSRINVGIFPPPLLFFPFSRRSARERPRERSQMRTKTKWELFQVSSSIG